MRQRLPILRSAESPPCHRALARLRLRDHRVPFVLKVLALTMVVVLAMAPMVATPPAAAAPEILWSADHESGDLSQWHLNDCGGEFNSGNGDAVGSQDVAKTGGTAARLTIDAQGSSHGTRLFRWCEPQSHAELYYSAWFYFPEQVTVSQWWNVFQFKSKTESQNDPFWILNVGNRQDGTMYLYAYDWINRVSHDQSVANLPAGQWVHIEAFYRSAGDTSGALTVWQDGVKIFDFTNIQTRYPNGDTQWSLNNYSDGLTPAPTTIYVDDAAISTGRLGGEG